MDSISYSVTQEPQLDVYHTLLEYALRPCRLGFVVVRTDIPLGAHGRDFLAELQPYMRSAVVAREWPGTKLLEGTALVHYFAYERETVNLLKHRSTRLFQWIQPDLPEDLGLLRSMDRPWLISISHESDAYFLLDEMELSDLAAHVPELKQMITPAQDPLS